MADAPKKKTGLHWDKCACGCGQLICQYEGKTYRVIREGKELVMLKPGNKKIKNLKEAGRLVRALAGLNS